MGELRASVHRADQVSGHRDLEVAADLARKKLLDLAMPRHGGDLPTVAVDINRMAAAFPEKSTAMPARCRTRSIRFTPAGVSRDQALANDLRARQLLL